MQLNTNRPQRTRHMKKDRKSSSYKQNIRSFFPSPPLCRFLVNHVKAKC